MKERELASLVDYEVELPSASGYEGDCRPSINLQGTSKLEALAQFSFPCSVRTMPSNNYYVEGCGRVLFVIVLVDM